MIIDKCENCKWSRGYNAPSREEAVLLMCVNPNIRYNNEMGDISIFCVSQRTHGHIMSYLAGTCGKHGRFFKQRGENGAKNQSDV